MSNIYDDVQPDPEIIEVELFLDESFGSSDTFAVKMRGKIAELTSEMVRKGFQLNPGYIKGPDVASEVLRLEFTRERDKKRARFSFMFIKDHAGRLVRVNTFEQANAIDTAVAEDVQKPKRTASVGRKRPSSRRHPISKPARP